MKVLFIHELPVIGGATLSLLELCKEFRQRDIDVHVLFFRTQGNAIDLFRAHEISFSIVEKGSVVQHAYGAYVPIFQWKFYRMLLVLWRGVFSISHIRRSIHDFSPDWVYLNSSLHLPGALAARLENVKIVWHVREQLHRGNIGFRRFFLRRFIDKLSKEIFVISRCNHQHLAIDRARVVYNGLNPALFKKEVGLETVDLIDHQEATVFLFLGGSVKSKGGDILVEAFKELCHEYSNVLLLFAGFINEKPSNRIEKRIDDIIKNCKLTNERILKVGALTNELVNYIQCSDFIVWPATVPHFSRPIMEALVLGTPVIASNFASTLEIIEGQDCGVLVEPNPLSIKRGMIMAIQNTKVYKSNAMAKRQYYQGLFDSKKNASVIIEILTKVH